MIFNVRLGEDRLACLVIVGVSPTVAKRSLPYCRSVSMKSQSVSWFLHNGEQADDAEGAAGDEGEMVK
jgi:hypothetical protein